MSGLNANVAACRCASLIAALAVWLLFTVAWAQEKAPESPSSQTPADTAEVQAETAEQGVEKSVPENPAYKHKGLYLRFSVGPGYSRFAAWYPSHVFILEAAALTPEVALGFSIVEDLEMTLGLSGTIMIAPGFDLSVADKSQTVKENQMTQINAGPGLTYYLPYNFYIGSGASISYLVFSLNKTGIEKASADIYGVKVDPLKPLDVTDATKLIYEVAGGHYVGFAVRAEVGKEWWVSEHTGMGIGLAYVFSIYPKFLGKDQETSVRRDRIIWYGHTASLMVTGTYN